MTNLADLEELRSLTAKQISELTGIKANTLSHWRNRPASANPGPPSFKVGGVVLYPLVEFREWRKAQDESRAASA